MAEKPKDIGYERIYFGEYRTDDDDRLTNVREGVGVIFYYSLGQLFEGYFNEDKMVGQCRIKETGKIPSYML